MGRIELSLLSRAGRVHFVLAWALCVLALLLAAATWLPGPNTVPFAAVSVVLVAVFPVFAVAHLCGVAPIPASSGRRDRHRLNRGGDRAANHALHTIVLCRMRWDERTRAYVERRTREGLATKDIMRCLKRHVAREVYRVLMRSTGTTNANPQTAQNDLTAAA